MPLANVLKHVRANRRFELADVARSTGISPVRLKEFEDGKRDPTFRQFEALAGVYGVPSYLLGIDALPNLAELPTDFRRLQPRPARLSPEGMQKIWDAERVAQAAKQLLTATKAPLALWIDTVPAGTPSAKTGSQLRVYFDEWLASRKDKLGFAGRFEQVFFGCFRMFVEAQGTIVRVNQAPPDDFVGFYLNVDAGLSTTFINRKIASPKAKLFTALHEYGHRMLGASGISDPFLIKNDVERSCNRFAAEFLAPEKDFISAVEQSPKNVRMDVFKLVDTISSQSLLSKHATAIRLKETGYLDQTQLNRWLEARAKLSGGQLKNEDVEDVENRFGAVHAKILGEVGYLPTYLAGVALQQKLISTVDVANSFSLSQSIQDRAISLATRRMEVAAS